VVLDAPTHVHVPYSFGVDRVDTVVKRGEVVASPTEGVRRPSVDGSEEHSP